MATTVKLAPHASTVWSKIWWALGHGRGAGGLRRAKRRIWLGISSADPEVAQADYLSLPCKVGDFGYRPDNDEVFICTVAVAQAQDGTFTQIVP